ncbi:MAG: SDR family oxidoreductase, partial [Anaerolineales bacterium]
TAKKTLLERWGSPEDIAKTLLFLIDADYITGQTIIVDGGEIYGHRKREAA